MFNEIWLIIQIFLVISIFGFVKRWTGNNLISLVVAAILFYIFVYRYPIVGAGWLVLSNLFLIIFFIWIIGLIIPK